jgi:hypothetical protein
MYFDRYKERNRLNALFREADHYGVPVIARGLAQLYSRTKKNYESWPGMSHSFVMRSVDEAQEFRRCWAMLFAAINRAEDVKDVTDWLRQFIATHRPARPVAYGARACMKYDQFEPKPTYEFVAMLEPQAGAAVREDQVRAVPAYMLRSLARHHVSVGIRCNTCDCVSWNPNDVEQLYCGFCHTFHDRIPTDPVVQLLDLVTTPSDADPAAPSDEPRDH